jgi:hypothetical protein
MAARRAIAATSSPGGRAKFMVRSQLLKQCQTSASSSATGAEATPVRCIPIESGGECSQIAADRSAVQNQFQVRPQGRPAGNPQAAEELRTREVAR